MDVQSTGYSCGASWWSMVKCIFTQCQAVPCHTAQASPESTEVIVAFHVSEALTPELYVPQGGCHLSSMQKQSPQFSDLSAPPGRPVITPLCRGSKSKCMECGSGLRRPVLGLGNTHCSVHAIALTFPYRAQCCAIPTFALARRTTTPQVDYNTTDPRDRTLAESLTSCICFVDLDPTTRGTVRCNLLLGSDSNSRDFARECQG